MSVCQAAVGSSKSFADKSQFLCSALHCHPIVIRSQFLPRLLLCVQNSHRQPSASKAGVRFESLQPTLFFLSPFACKTRLRIPMACPQVCPRSLVPSTRHFGWCSNLPTHPTSFQTQRSQLVAAARSLPPGPPTLASLPTKRVLSGGLRGTGPAQAPLPPVRPRSVREMLSEQNECARTRFRLSGAGVRYLCQNQSARIKNCTVSLV